jgi:hypothetical protein
MYDKNLYSKGFTDGFNIGAFFGSITAIIMFVILWYLTH